MSIERKSAAPAPPNLRDAAGDARCETCHMYDEAEGLCWGYGNYDVRQDQICDSYSPEPEAKAAGEDLMTTTTLKVAGLEELKAAINTYARGGEDHDGDRRYIIERARAIGHADFVPDNWDKNGALANRDRVWQDAEQRETFNDVASALSDALRDQVAAWCWLMDFDDDCVYYQTDECLYSAPYSIEPGGPVAIGEGQRVRSITSYVPAERSDERPKVTLPNMIAARRKRMTKRGEMERRSMPMERLELRNSDLEVRDEAGEPTQLLEFHGYASVFERSYNVGPYEETIDRGAFKRSLGNSNLDVVLRTEHNSLPLARTTGSIKLADGSEVPTLRLAEDETGLEVRALLDPSDPDVQRLIPKYRRGDLKEMSFAFRCVDDVWSDDYAKRTVRTAEIHRGDVSIVTYGASQSTNSTLRDEDQVLELRSVGPEGLVGSLQDFAFQWVGSYLSVHGERKTLEELEGRAGRILSSTSMDTLVKVLNLVADADEAVDEAQPLLADLMGVPNPDADEDEEDEPQENAERSDPPEEKLASEPLPQTRYDEFEVELRALEV